MGEFVEAAVQDLLRQRRWHEWPRAREMAIDEFQDATMEDIKAALLQADIHCSDDQAAAIAGRLWRILRGE